MLVNKLDLGGFFCLDLLVNVYQAYLPYLCRLRFSCFARLKRTCCFTQFTIDMSKFDGEWQCSF